MDNDDFRRGVPTNHKVFGEAMAILAGDALLTLAFRLVAENLRRPRARTRPRAADVLAEIADAAGTAGMVGGQVADIESEGKRASAEMLDYIHAHKTGALHPRLAPRGRADLRAGDAAARRARRRPAATSGWPSRSSTTSSTSTASSAELGKTAGKDQAQQKATYPGRPRPRRLARGAPTLIDEAEARAGAARRRAPSPSAPSARFIVERKA